MEIGSGNDASGGGQIARGTGVARDDGAVAKVQAGAHRRGDAHVRHAAGHDQWLVHLADLFGQVGATERIWSRLLDDPFALDRSKLVDDLTARCAAIEGAAGATLVGDMDDARAGGAGGGQEASGIGDGRFDFDQLQWTGAVLVLVIDQDQRG